MRQTHRQCDRSIGWFITLQPFPGVEVSVSFRERQQTGACELVDMRRAQEEQKKSS
jgi:hypothetical protein